MSSSTKTEKGIGLKLMNLLTVLNNSFGLSVEQIEQGIVLRANKVYADTYFIEDWLKDEKLIPNWASRAAASWLVELWLSERDNCDSTSLKSDRSHVVL